MKILVAVVLSGLTPYLMANLLRLLLPKECYIWLRSKYPVGSRLIDAAVIIPFLLWLLFVAATILLEYHPVDQADAMTTLAFILVPPVLLVLAKVLLKILWKPTPEMLAHNDRAVAEELEQVQKEMQKQQTQPVSQQTFGRCWQCPNCGSKNDESEQSCLRCGRAAALWGEQPVYFTEEEE